MIHAWCNYRVIICSDATYNIEAIYKIVQQKFKSHSTYQLA